MQGKPGVQTLQQQNALMAIHDPAQHQWFMQFQEHFFGEVIKHMYDS